MNRLLIIDDDEVLRETLKHYLKSDGFEIYMADGGISGLKKLIQSGQIKKNDLTVAFITGAGPRTQDIISDIVNTITVTPALESVENALGVPV